MNVKFDRLSDVTAEVTVTLTEEDYKEKVKKQLREIGAKRPEPGFRAGHVPASLLQKKYGTAVKYDVVNQEVSEALYNYIQENKLRVLGQPVPVRNEQFDINSADFEFRFEVGLAPEIKLEINKDITVPYYNIEVSDEMIDQRDEAMRRRYGKQIPGEEMEPDAVVKGVITELDAEGKPLEGGIVVENGVISPKYFTSEEQRKLFEGKKSGDTVVFNPAETCNSNPAEMSSMLNIDKNQIDEHKGDFSFEIKEIIVLRPAELGEEYYEAAFGKDKVHDEKEYREALKESIAASLKADSNYRFTIDAKDALMAQAGDIDLPDQILKDFLKMQNEGMSDEEAEVEYSKAVPSLKWDLVRDAAAEKLEIKLDESDMRDMARMLAAQQFSQYGMTNVPDDVLNRYADNILADKKYREQLANQALDTKLFNAIRASVTVDDKTVSIADFNKLFAPAEA